MDQTQARENSPVTTGLVFTNTQGAVIFVDHPFLDMLRFGETVQVTGEPLYKVLGLDEKLTKALLDEVQKSGTVKHRALQVTRPDGSQFDVHCSATATRDSKGRFIGADITLRRERAAGEESDALTNTQVRSALARPGSPEDNVFVQLYFTTHLKSLYILMVRLLGLWVREHLDRIINEVSTENGWSIRIQDGLFLSDLNESSVIVFRGLIVPTMDYAVNMIGRKVVSREVEKVDSGFHPGLLKLADQAGLRELISQRL
jgi:hypothetical protein